MKDAHCVPDDLVERMRNVVDNFLNKMAEAIRSEQRNVVMREFTKEATSVNALLPR
jgi:hypothetical protein